MLNTSSQVSKKPSQKWLNAETSFPPPPPPVEINKKKHSSMFFNSAFGMRIGIYYMMEKIVKLTTH